MSEHGGRRADPHAQLSPLTPASIGTAGNDEVDLLHCIGGQPASVLGGLQQPKLVEDDSTTGPSPLPQASMSNDTSSSSPATTNHPPPMPPSLGPRSATMAKSTSPRQQSRTQHVSLRELASNPLEDEAENAIVRAIEARERKEKAEGHDQPAAAGIFSGVSEAALKIVLEEESDNGSGGGVVGNTNDNDVASRTGMSSVGGPPPSSPRSRSSPTKSATSVGSNGSNQHPTPRHRSPTSSYGNNKGPANFQDLANQLKNAQSTRFLSAAAAGRSRRDLGMTNVRRSEADGEDDSNGGGDDSDDGRELCAADGMVRNMNKMLGLPNHNVDVEEEKNVGRRKVEAFDIEAQRPLAPPVSSPRSSPQQGKKPAAQNWAKVRLGVNASANVAAAASEAKEAAEAERAQFASNIDGNDAAAAPDKKEKDKEPASVLKTFGRVFAVRSQNILGDISSSLNIKFALKVLVGFLIVPSMLVSAILFYAAGNPMPGEQGELAQSSYSWWILFVGARQVCTLALSKLTEIIVVDVLTLKSRTLLKLFGPLVSLLIIQARGWPYVLTFWGVFNFAFLQGRHSFAKHWLFYTNIAWFSECSDTVVYPDCNPAGSVVYSDMYTRVLIAMIVFGAAASIKRVAIALYQGKKSTEHYGPQLQKLMEKMLTISELGRLADEIEAIRADRGQHYYSIHGTRTAKDGGLDFNRLRKMKRQEDDSEDEDEYSQSTSSSPPPSPARSRTSSKASPSRSSTKSVQENASHRYVPSDAQSAQTFASNLTKRDEEVVQTLLDEDGDGEDGEHDGDEQANIHLALNDSAKVRLMELLDAWEEPTVIVGRRNKKVSIKDVLSFRQAALCLDSKHPFSYAFGAANTREQCIESAYIVYQQLLMHTPGETVLPFDTLALIALNGKGEIDEEKARKLIRRFRPSRDGSLGTVDFVRSVDKVYKEVRTLRASIANSSQLYLAVERLVNVAFYFVLCLIALTIVNLNPGALFVSLSGVILSFAFLFGKAGSSIFIGIIFILVQQPFDIGDKIHISNANVDTSPAGSPTWFVDGITLFSTTVRRAATNEVATHSNGSLADSRIINANRSPQAIACVYLKFSVDVPFDRIMFFKTVVEAFVKDRPTEWISFSAFRATRIEADLGFIEYVVALQHVEKWQNGGPIAQSKADVASFCLEAMKKLDMRYVAPPKPVNLNFANGNSEISSDWEALRTAGTGDGPALQPRPSDQDFSFLASLFAKPGSEEGAKKRK